MDISAAFDFTRLIVGEMKRLANGCVLLAFLALVVSSSVAMVNPEGIQWRAAPANFIASLFQATLGRGPTQEEMTAWLNMNLATWNGRLDAYYRLLGSNEYKAMFGYLERKYDVYWNYRQWDDGQRVRMCRCYSVAQFIRGPTPALQFTGIPYPAGRMTWPHAYNIYLLCGLNDSGVCPSADCGFRGNWGGGGGGGDVQTGVNLIVQGNFAIFGQPGHGWGTGLYSQNGIWWNSGGARSFAQSIKLNNTPGVQNQILTALYIRNDSSRAPNVYGTTSQRINVKKGVQYEIRLFVSARNLASNGGVTIAIDPHWQIRPIRLPAGTYGWQELSGKFTAPDNYIDLRIISEDRGEVYLTGARMYPAGAATQAATSSPCDTVCDQYCKSLAKAGGKLSPTGVCLMGTTSPGPAQACTCW